MMTKTATMATAKCCQSERGLSNMISPLMQGGKYVVQKRETKAINKLCVREILSLFFVCGAYFFEFRGRNLVCFGISYNFDWGRHMQIRVGSREGTHAQCVFHACRASQTCGREKVSSAQGACANQNAFPVVNQKKKLSKMLQKDLK